MRPAGRVGRPATLQRLFFPANSCPACCAAQPVPSTPPRDRTTGCARPENPSWQQESGNKRRPRSGAPGPGKWGRSRPFTIKQGPPLREALSATVGRRCPLGLQLAVVLDGIDRSERPASGPGAVSVAKAGEALVPMVKSGGLPGRAPAGGGRASGARRATGRPACTPGIASTDRRGRPRAGSGSARAAAGAQGPAVRTESPAPALAGAGPVPRDETDFLARGAPGAGEAMNWPRPTCQQIWCQPCNPLIPKQGTGEHRGPVVNFSDS